jgi:non-ribosomal peptide synthetase component F
MEVTIGYVSRKVSAKDRKENIGRPFPACSAYTVNSKMDILPLGVAGELVIGGLLVARGYHRLPEVTAKSFIEWPTKGCRAYRTSDLGIFVALVADTRLISIYHIVRMTAEGTLLVHGRIDSQIKLRGVRIESEGVSEVVHKSARGRTSTHTLIASHPKLGSEILVSFFASDNHTGNIAPFFSHNIVLKR